jgi:putative phage-type endonuclease
MSIYEILNVEQGSDVWLQERLKRVTASQIPSLLGLSPYQSVYQLLEEKLSGQAAEVDGYKKYLFKKGHEAERSAREWAESDLGFKLPPKVVVSKHCEGLLASLDGFNEEPNINVILEVKYMGAKSIEEVKKGKIKPHHECQIQAQLLASGAKYCIYFATTESGESAILNVKPNQVYFEKIKSAVKSFMDDINAYFELKQGLLNKYMMSSGRPLKVLASGAKDPFRVKSR